jgi:hypothetical protein
MSLDNKQQLFFHGVNLLLAGDSTCSHSDPWGILPHALLSQDIIFLGLVNNASDNIPHQQGHVTIAGMLVI